jgi:3-oxoacyl-[acyl-carrier-protein] synthase II
VISGSPAETRYRVVLTGIGLVSGLGDRAEEFWRRLSAGETAVGELTRFDPARSVCRMAAEVHDSDFEVRGEYAHEVKRAGRFVQYAVAAGERATADSGLEISDDLEGGLFLGVSLGGLDKMEEGVLRQESRGPRNVSPYLITSMLPNMAASLMSLRLGVSWSQMTIAGACASGAQALGEAFRAIRSGRLHVALAGGCDAVLTPIAFSSFHAMRMLSRGNDPDCSPRPFDVRGDGMVVGEGAAVFVLEEREHALARGAKIYAEITGYGTSSSSGSMSLPNEEDCLRAMRAALRDVAIDPHDVDCIFAQAAGVRLGDHSELAALKSLFCSNGRRPAMVSIKGHIGHTFAASGPLSVLAATGAVNGRPLPPTRNLEQVDPEFESLNLFRGSDTGSVRHCLVNSFGLGGVNAALVVSSVQTVP